jgi:trans-aconitate 2-methyltransferase
VQLPANHESPLHLALLETAQRPEWAQATAGCAGMIVYHEPDFYYDLLASRTSRVALWRTTYYHILPGHQGMVDWYSSTGMKTYLSRLADEQERRTFAGQVLDACREKYPLQADGKILFPFRRLFFIAYRD